MIHDLITAILVAFAAVIASEVMTRIWEYGVLLASPQPPSRALLERKINVAIALRRPRGWERDDILESLNPRGSF
jgi:hypothetical protein